MTPDLYTLTAQEVLDCICTALSAVSCGCPCNTFVAVGRVAWDHCCNEGQLWVGVERVYTTLPASQPITCSASLTADMVVGLLRCAPVVDDNGRPPSPEALTASSAQVYEDAYAVMAGLICCLAAAKKYRQFRVGEQSFLGPQGGCVGSETRFTVQLADPLPPMQS